MSSGSISFTYDPSTRIRTAIYQGVIDDAELLAAYRKVIAEPDFDIYAQDLADLRDVEQLNLSSKGLGQLGLLLSGGGEKPSPDQLTKLAIVGTRPDVFGMGRMYEMATESFLPKETKVFREIDEARAWLVSN
ncbi:MAG: hypothetical protein KJ626_07550 [Verrucomicrobia bacterium]|nr:hypothetical protein [Verrucomicrobiota bacterium]